MSALRFIISLFIYFSILTSSSLLGQQSIKTARILHFDDESGLPQNSAEHLQFDKNGYLWIGTQGGLVCYDGSKFLTKFTEESDLKISYLFKDLQNNVFVVTSKQNLYKSVGISNKLIKINSDSTNYIDYILPKNKKDTTNINENYWYSLLHNNGENNLYHLDENGGKFQNFVLPKDIIKHRNFLVGNLLLTIGEQDGISLKSDIRKKFKFSAPLDDVNLTEIYQHGFFFDDRNHTFLLFDNKLYELKIKNEVIIPIIVMDDIPLSMSKDKIVCGAYNKNKKIFALGSATQGLYILTQSGFKNVQTEYLNNIYGTENAFYNLAAIHQNQIVTGNNYLFSANGSSSIFGPYPPIERHFVYLDYDNNLWFWNNGLAKKNLKTNKTTQVFPSSISGMIQTKEKTIYIHSEYYLNKLIQKQDGTYFWSEGIITTPQIIQLIDFSDDYLWVVSKTKIIEVKKSDYSSHCIYENNSIEIRHVKKSNKTHFWIGTYGHGFILFKDGKFTNMPIDKNGYLKISNAFLSDDQGYLWITTNKGLFQVLEQDLLDYVDGCQTDVYFHYYDKSYGFGTNEFNGGCQTPAVITSDNKFSFSSMNGLVQFYPSEIKPILPDGEILLHSVTIDSIKWYISQNKLVLNPDFNSFTLNVSSPYFGHPANLNIQYRLSGYEDNWQDLNSDQTIKYGNINFGNYELQIRHKAGFGFENYIYKKVSIIVLPYFYETWWFFITVLVLLSIVIILIMKFYVRKLNMQKLNLEKLIIERNKSLIETNKELQERIKQNEMFHSIMVHDIKAPIFFIGTISNEILQSYDRLEKDDVKNNLETIRQASYSINAFIVDFLTWAKHRIRTNHFDKEQVNILDIMKDLVSFHNNSDKIKRGRLIITINCDQSLCVFTNKQLLKIILNNLLSNSIKFSSQGTITLYAFLDTKDNIIIGCKDQGKGMDEKLMTLLTNDKYNGNSIREDSFRMGYVFINDIIKILNASINIQSQLGVGTDITIKIDKTT